LISGGPRSRPVRLTERPRVGMDWPAALAGEVRANPAYRFTSLLSAGDRYRDSLERLGVDTRPVFGFLVAPPHSGLPNKLVDQSAVELFERLQQAGRPPANVIDRLPELVLDGVLEVEGPEGFVSGPLAYDAFGDGSESWPAGDRLARLSRAALEYAERLRLADADSVAARLYAYHRLPFSRRWARACPGPDAVRELLPERTLSRHWTVSAVGRPSHWLSWSFRSDVRRSDSDRFLYKVYVSPRIEDLPAVLPPVVDALTAACAPRFKIGADAAGLLRPDKLVVYLRDAKETTAVATALAESVGDASPHGVPFSAELAGGGLLSWGGDPPPDAAPIGLGRESWRLAICRRLADYLVRAQRTSLQRTRPLDFALARLAFDSVDPRTFAPADLAPPWIPGPGERLSI
jgi:hypothetical protein